MKDNKGTKEDQLLYKTIDRLEQRDKGRFWFTVLIISSVVLAITTLLMLGYSLNQKRESERLKLENARLKAEREKVAAEEDLRELAQEVVSVIAKQEETEYVRPNPNKEPDLERKLSQIALRADNILSTKNAGKTFKDTLFVWSHVGLNIRDQPEMEDSEITWGFPLGTPLHILQNGKTQSDSFEINALAGKFELSGAFVVVERDSIRGYGFTGLLSPLPAFISAKSIRQYHDLASRNPALVEKYGLAVTSNGPQEVTLKTKNLSVQEVFLLMRNLYGFDSRLRAGQRATRVSQSRDKWAITIGDLAVSVDRTPTGVNATVVNP